MKKVALTVLLILCLSASCLFAGSVVPKTLLEKFSYVLGYCQPYYFYYYQAYYYPEALEEYGYYGALDASNGTCLYTDEQMNTIINDYIADYSARMTELAKTNLAEAEAFLSENAKNKDIKTTESGLQYKIIKQGSGQKPSATDQVELDYKLTLLDGTVADSSYARGEHSTFGMNQVIKGFSEGVCLMPLGSHYIFYIHPDLGYGEANMGNIEPNSLLVFEVETYAIVK